MMRVHELKCKEPYFVAVLEQRKTAELRYDDRDFQVGDRLLLIEEKQIYETGRKITCLITHVLKGKPWLADNYAMLSFKILDEAPK